MADEITIVWRITHLLDGIPIGRSSLYPDSDDTQAWLDHFRSETRRHIHPLFKLKIERLEVVSEEIVVPENPRPLDEVVGSPKYKIGDVHVVETPCDNPYRYRGTYSIGEERKQALRRFYRGEDTEGLELWHAPAEGGAKRITTAEVNWETSGVV